MNRWRLLSDPILGRTSIARVVWVYGVLVPLAYSFLGVLFEARGPFWMHAYTLGGLLLGLYVGVATYRCARNCRTVFGRRLVQVCAVLSLLLLPVLTYLEWNGALELTSLRGLE